MPQIKPWFLDKICATAKAPVLHEATLNFSCDKTWTPDDVQNMLDYLDPGMGYSEWINVGMALNHGGYSFDIWDNWSKRSAKYDNSTHTHWRSFKPNAGISMGTLVDMAKVRGWKPDSYITEATDWEKHPAKEFFRSIGVRGNVVPIIREHPEVEPSPHLKINPLLLPAGSVVGETVRFLTHSSNMPQPELALICTLAALGAVFGRRYASPINTRTNLFIVGLCQTGSGKDMAREMVRKIMEEAGLLTYIGPNDVKSGPGLCTTMQKKPSCVMMIDEFGKILQGIVGDAAASHKAEIGTAMLNLYSSSGKSYYAGTYADAKQATQEIKDPNLSIFGTSTLESYIKALKRIAIDDGHLNRFIVLPGRDKPELNLSPDSRKIPDHVLEAWRTIAPLAEGLESLNNPQISPFVKTVDWGTGTKEEIEKYGTSAALYQQTLLVKQHEMVHPNIPNETCKLWARYRENTIKIAMILAICKNTVDPKIDMEDFTIAEKIVSSAIEYVADLATNHMYENDIERNKKEVLKHIRKMGRDGIARTDLMRKCSFLKRRDFDDIVATLVEEELIGAEMEKSSTKARVIYRRV